MGVTGSRSTARKSLIASILTIMGFASACPPAVGQDVESRFTAAWRGLPLDSVLVAFASISDADISWDPLVVKNKTVYCVARASKFEDTLACILHGTGLDFVRRSSGLYTIILASRGPPIYGNLRGIILDADTEQPVSNAHILLADISESNLNRVERGRVASDEGMFIFGKLLPGDYRMTVSHVGYRRTSSLVEIRAGAISSTEVTLESEVVAITSPLIIDGIGMEPSSTLLGSSTASQEEVLANLSSGTSGLLTALDAMPGVRVNDATADIHIQGGEAGEHQFRLDGAPIFLPLNVASFIGPFSPFAIGKIRVNKAGFDVTLGSQIAGVIEAEHDLRIPSRRGGSGDPRRASQLTAQVDPLSLNARFNTVWSKPGGFHATYMGAFRLGTWNISAPVSLRRLLDDWNAVDSFLLSAFASRNTPFSNLPPEGSPSIGFLDWHNAAKIRFGPLRSLNLSTYFGSNSLGNDLTTESVLRSDATASDPSGVSKFRDIYRWKNGAAQARYESIMGAHTLGSIRTRASFYRLKHDFIAPDTVTAESAEDDGNRVMEISIDGKLDYEPVTGHFLEFGTEMTLTSNRFIVAGTQLIPLRHSSSNWRTAGYINDKIQVGRHVLLEGGVRFTYLNARQTLYGEPRLSARFDWKSTPFGGVSLFIGSGIYRQFVNQFDVSSRSPRTFASTTRFWLGVDSSVKPPKAGHLAGELLILPNSTWTLRFEGHYKRLYHLLSIDYASGSTSRNNNLKQSEFLKSTTGYTYGYATRIARKVGAGSAHVRLDYSVSRRRIEDLFRNDLLTVPWNEPWRLEAGFDLVPFTGFVMLARWKSIWGRQWGFRQAYYDFLSADLNSVEAVLEDMRSNGVSADAVRRIERQIEHFDLTRPDRHRLPAIHQLDFGVAYSIPLESVGVQLRLDVTNLLNRTNTADWRFLFNEDTYFGEGGSGTSGLLERSIRPLLPRVISFAARLTL